jgi:glycine cleavage system H protein
MRPDDLKYTETHEWVRVSGKIATVGITDYAISQLSDLVHLELPKVGEEVEQGSPFGEIESVKAVVDLNAPVSGKVTEINKALLSDLEMLSNDPFEEGWLIKIRISDPSELQSLMSAEEYAEFIEVSEEGGEKPSEEEEGIDEDDFM